MTDTTKEMSEPWENAMIYFNERELHMASVNGDIAAIIYRRSSTRPEQEKGN